MAVELVIRLSEKDCEHIKRLGALWIETEIGLSIVSKALLNGTILPKGHGKLGDVDYALNKLENADDAVLPKTPNEGYAWDFAQAVLKHIPIIIDADKESKESEGKR